MATASKKIEATPFLVRRVSVLEKLKANKEWLEESHLQVRDNPATEETVSAKTAVTWAKANWDEVLKSLTESHKNGTLEFSYHHHRNYSDPDSPIEVLIYLHEVPTYPYRKDSTNTNIQELNEAIKQAFVSYTDHKGVATPSTYQKICQYVALFEQSTDEFIDAKFYSDLPTLIPDFKAQFNTVQQIK
jgi:hypothetical protein